MSLKTEIAKTGQLYVDEPIYVKPKAGTELQTAVAVAFGGKPPQPIMVGHERVRLQWMEPDGNGGMREKYPRLGIRK